MDYTLSNTPEVRSTLAYAEVEGPVVQQLIWGKLMPALQGEPMDAAIISMIAFCILLMKPDVKMEVLESAITQTTEVMTLAIADLGHDTVN